MVSAGVVLHMTGASDCGHGCGIALDFANLGITSIDPSAFATTGLWHVKVL
jgi:hypothetical protein